jgi:predicted transposase YbfD/YdcC
MQDEWHVQHTQHIKDTVHTNEMDHNQHKGEHAKAMAQAALMAHGYYGSHST